MPGSCSISPIVARSRSTGDCGVGAFFTVSARLFRSDLRFALAPRAESTRPIWRVSALASAGDGGGDFARQRRTPLPESATNARNQSALRSFAVGTTQHAARGENTRAESSRAGPVFCRARQNMVRTGTPPTGSVGVETPQHDSERELT